MPIDVTSDQLKPVLVLHPDSRFGVSLLDVKYRKYAVTNEALMDKSTGELFFRRKEDGKLVSFNQDYRDLYEQVWQLNIVRSLNPEFSYPDSTDAFLLSTIYDLGCINGEQNVFIQDLIKNSNGVMQIHNYNESDSVSESLPDIQPERTLQFKVAMNSQGFIVRLITRPVDKVVIEYLTKAYDKTFGSVPDEYSSDPFFTAENAKLSDVIFSAANTAIKFDVVINGKTNNNKMSYDDNIAWVRLNSPSFVDLSTIIGDAIQTGNLEKDEPYTVDIFIKEIDPYKIRFMIENMETLDTTYGTDIKSNYDATIYADNLIGLQNINVLHFIDTIADIIDLGNQRTVSAFTVDTAKSLMGDINSIKSNATFILSAKEPDKSDWATNAIWGEVIKGINMSTGDESTTNAKADMEWIESRVTGASIGYTKISNDPNDRTAILISGKNSESGDA